MKRARTVFTRPLYYVLTKITKFTKKARESFPKPPKPNRGTSRVWAAQGGAARLCAAKINPISCAKGRALQFLVFYFLTPPPLPPERRTREGGIRLTIYGKSALHEINFLHARDVERTNQNVIKNVVRARFISLSDRKTRASKGLFL
jgi:hypothetical protein